MMLNLRYMVVSNNDLVKIVSTLLNQLVYISQTKNTKGNHIMIQNDVELKIYGSKQ